MDADEFLQHYGVKGMRWGVRKREDGGSGPSDVNFKNTKPGTRVKTTGGERHPAHEDARRAAVARQKVKKSTTDALSNKELQELVQRMNLEQQYARLQVGTKGPAAKFVHDLLLGVGKQQAARVANDYASEHVGEFLKNRKS